MGFIQLISTARGGLRRSHRQGQEAPVQVPVKFEMAVNAKTAKALGLTVPSSIRLRADEVIE